MKKRTTRCIVALMLCLIMCVATTITAFAASIPYKNCHTTGNGDFTFTIDTRTFSGYENTTIGHFTVQNQNYSSNAIVTVSISKGNKSCGFAMLQGNEKLNDCVFDQFLYQSPGVYTITISVVNSSSGGWTGIWLFH